MKKKNSLNSLDITIDITLDNLKELKLFPLKPENSASFLISSTDSKKYGTSENMLLHMLLFSYDLIPLIVDKIRDEYKKKDLYYLRTSIKYPTIKTVKIKIKYSVIDNFNNLQYLEENQQLELFPDNILIQTKAIVQAIAIIEEQIKENLKEL